MAIYYTQILNPQTKKILTGAFSLAGTPLKPRTDILVDLKNTVASLPSREKTFSLHAHDTLFYFRVSDILLCSITDTRTTATVIAKYFDEVEGAFTARHDTTQCHYEFDDTIKALTDRFNKRCSVLLGVEELETTHSALVENLDTLINRGENINTLKDLAERVNFETREMSRKVSQMKLNAKIEQYKIYAGVILAVIILMYLYFR